MRFWRKYPDKLKGKLTFETLLEHVEDCEHVEEVTRACRGSDCRITVPRPTGLRTEDVHEEIFNV